MSVRGVRAGKVYVEAYLQDDKLTRGLTKAQRHLAGFGAAVGAVGARMAAVGGAVLAGFGAAGWVFAKFEDQMQRVATMLREPEKWMKNFSQAVKDMAEEFGESTEMITHALYDVLSAQIKPENAIEFMRVAAKAAIGGQTDIRTASVALITVLKAYNLEATHAADVSDLMFAIVEKGLITYDDLSESLGMAASMAAAAGVSLEELGAVIATMTRAKLNPRVAMTALRATLMSIMKGSTLTGAKSPANQMKDLGIELSQATLEAIGLEGIIRQLGTRRFDVLAKYFSRRSAQGLVTVTQQLGGFNKDMEDMANRAGAAERAYKKMANTLLRWFKRVRSALKIMVIEIGGAIAPILKVAAVIVTRVLKSTTQWVKANKMLFVSLLAIASAVTVVGVALISLGIGMKILAVAAFGLAAAWGLLVTLFTTAISPLILLGAAFGILAGIILVKTGIIGKALKWLGGLFAPLVKRWTEAFGLITELFKAGEIKQAMELMWVNLKLTWLVGVQFLIGWWEWFRVRFIKIMVWIGAGAIRLATEMVIGIAKAISWLVEGIKGIWSGAVFVMILIWEGLGWAINVVATSIVKAWRWALRTIVQLFWGGIEAITDSWSWMLHNMAVGWEIVKSAAKKAWAFIANLFSGKARKAAYEKIDEEMEAKIEEMREKHAAKIAKRDDERAKGRDDKQAEFDKKQKEGSDFIEEARLESEARINEAKRKNTQEIQAIEEKGGAQRLRLERDRLAQIERLRASQDGINKAAADAAAKRIGELDKEIKLLEKRAKLLTVKAEERVEGIESPVERLRAIARQLAEIEKERRGIEGSRSVAERWMSWEGKRSMALDAQTEALERQKKAEEALIKKAKDRATVLEARRSQIEGEPGAEKERRDIGREMLELAKKRQKAEAKIADIDRKMAQSQKERGRLKLSDVDKGWRQQIEGTKKELADLSAKEAKLMEEQEKELRRAGYRYDPKAPMEAALATAAVGMFNVQAAFALGGGIVGVPGEDLDVQRNTILGESKDFLEEIRDNTGEGDTYE